MTAHRGWTIHYDPPPIPIRNCDYQATDPNGDGEPNAYGRTVEECRAEIDAILEERGSA
jgi:hypothetical protein